jgi:hypothetical protein
VSGGAWIAGLLAWLSLGGCATVGSTMGSDICPEYRSMRCMTAPECSMDQQRGCRVCACSGARPADREGRLTNPIAPDQRIPERR